MKFSFEFDEIINLDLARNGKKDTLYTPHFFAESIIQHRFFE
jgi:hypothetical protein